MPSNPPSNPPANPPASPSPASIGGRYHLAERIGTGGYSEVWRARDDVLGRPVAVKLLHEAYAQHPESLHRFRAEARHAGSVSHQNIARVYDYGDPDASHPAYLVMEFVAGQSLAELLRGGHPLDAALCMDIVAQTAAGLAAAHEAGLVHRDIKPANLLLSPPGIVKITDFGISHAVGSAPVTSTGVIIGTPGYLAPERAAGAQATYLSDLYSLGVVAYECLTGRPPFDGTALEVALAHQTRSFPDLPATVPAGAAALIRQLTAKEPDERPATAREVAERAASLRDGLRAGTTPTLEVQLPAAGPGADLGATRAMAAPAEATRGSDRLGWRGSRPAGGRAGRRRGWRLAAGGAAVAGLVALTVVGVVSASTGGSGTGATHQAGAAAATKIDVDARALVGKPVGAVVRQLRREGFAVRVKYRLADEDQAGLVLRVRPAGKLPIETVITLVAGLGEFRHGHHDHHGDGGNGNGGGGDHGGGGGGSDHGRGGGGGDDGGSVPGNGYGHDHGAVGRSGGNGWGGGTAGTTHAAATERRIRPNAGQLS